MSQTCAELHELLTGFPRHGGDFEDSDLPRNGLYILFQKGEAGHGTDRIVRVGTHRRDAHLISRLHEHFHKLNKDKSIFRKHLGRALLARSNDPFLEQWDWDPKTRREHERLGNRLDKARQREVECEVSKYLSNNFTFTVLSAETKDERLRTEKKLLSTLASCNQCRPSPNWLGLHHPHPKIQSVGLWNIQGLKGHPLAAEDVDEIIRPMVLRAIDQSTTRKGETGRRCIIYLLRYLLRFLRLNHQCYKIRARSAERSRPS